MWSRRAQCQPAEPRGARDVVPRGLGEGRPTQMAMTAARAECEDVPEANCGSAEARSGALMHVGPTGGAHRAPACAAGHGPCCDLLRRKDGLHSRSCSRSRVRCYRG